MSVRKFSEGTESLDDLDNSIHRGEEERASFVGTTSSLKLLIPDSIQLIVQSLCFVLDHLKIRPIEQAESKAWHLFPDELTRLIPSFDDSISLLAA
jgi:hypothetical protein